ncbi:MAG: phage tail protein [Rhabdaerophilum sp.]
MAKVLRTVGKVAGVVASVAAIIPGGQGIAAIAAAVAAVASIGANLLTKPPPARGSVTETLIAVDPPSPYVMGEGYFSGVMRHRTGYGPTLKKVKNPFLLHVLTLSVAGPIEGPIVPQVDFGNVPAWYNGFLGTDTRLGARPDTALVPPLQAPAPGWTAAHRLSSTAAIAWGHKFDKDGERFASGLPVEGVLAKWVKVYDPRKDSTQPGGVGAHRLGDEATYEWSENPALHAGTYAFGRYVNGKRVMGVGLPAEGIDWEGVAAWANDCEANGWAMFGVAYEGAANEPERRWANLTDICIAGGGQPLFAGAVLGFHWHRPRVALDTVTEADLAEGPQEVTAQQSYRDRLNTVIARYLSPAHNWQMTQAAAISVPAFVAEDGEPRTEEVPLNFVKGLNQAAQLVTYWLWNTRELAPITLTVMPRLRAYRPGECLRLVLPELGLDHDAVILSRQFDPATMTTTLTFVSETAAKHAFALGRTGTAPPTPALGQTGEERDKIASGAQNPPGFATIEISSSYTVGLAGNITQAALGGGVVEVTIPTHTRVYTSGREVTVTGGVIALPESVTRLIYYDDADRAGGAVTFAATATPEDAYFSATNPDRHFIGYVTTVDGAGAGGGVGGSGPPGGGGWDGPPGTEIP